MITWFRSLFTLTLTSFSLAAQVLPPRTDTNPALLYYRAILHSPDLRGLSDEAQKLLYSTEYDSISWSDASIQSLVTLYDDSFQLLRRAATSTTPCDWGIDLSVDPLDLGAFHSHLRALTARAGFRARYFLETQQPDRAVSDLVAAWTLARNLPTNLTLLSILVGSSIERTLDEFVAVHFHQFNVESLRALATGLDQLPARASVPDTVEVERQLFVTALEELRAKSPDDVQALIEQLRDWLVREFQTSQEQMDRLLPAPDRASQEQLQHLETMFTLHPDIEALLRLPPREYAQRRAKAEEEAERHDNLLPQGFVEAAIKARNADLSAQVHQAMLQAAIRYRIDGPAALDHTHDPCASGPFGFSRVTVDGVDRGFALESALQWRGFHEKLIFIEVPGPGIFVVGPRAGELRQPPPERDAMLYDREMLRRYGILPGRPRRRHRHPSRTPPLRVLRHP